LKNGTNLIETDKEKQTGKIWKQHFLAPSPSRLKDKHPSAPPEEIS
jgi:hypothetical protein